MSRTYLTFALLCPKVFSCCVDWLQSLPLLLGLQCPSSCHFSCFAWHPYLLLHAQHHLSFCNLVRALLRFTFLVLFRAILEIGYWDIRALFCCFLQPIVSLLVSFHTFFNFSQLSSIHVIWVLVVLHILEDCDGKLLLNEWIFQKVGFILHHAYYASNWSF